MVETVTPRQRSARRQPNRWKVIFVALLVAGLLATLIWVLLGSRLLVVRHIDVHGAKTLTRQQVVAAGRVRLGAPMARLDTGGIERRIAAMPQVEKVSVGRDWPATVSIVIVERTPAAVARTAPGRWAVLDRFGVTIATVATPDAALPQLQVAAEGPADPVTRAALGALSGLPASLRDRVRTVSAESTESIVFHLTGSAPGTIVWGANERTAEKLRLVKALGDSAAGRGARTIDVSSPEVVTTS